MTRIRLISSTATCRAKNIFLQMAPAMCAHLVCLFAPPVMYLLICMCYYDDPCNEHAQTPDLAIWLMVQAAAHILAMLKLKCDSPHHSILSVIIEHVLCRTFPIGWAILGVVKLSRDEHCQDKNPTLYYTVLAAVTITCVEFAAKFLKLFVSKIRQRAYRQTTWAKKWK